MLPLLRIFNCHPEGKLKVPSEMTEELNGRIYLLTFIKLSELFFRKI